MDNIGRARAMRAEGKSRAAISRELGISQQWAYKCTAGAERSLRETDTTVVRHGALNGGCSTQSGMIPISMPRIQALHGVAA